MGSRVKLDSRVPSWSTNVARRIFTTDPEAEDTVDLRWNCLTLLALARTRSPDVTGQGAIKSPDPVQQAAVVEWQTVCILAILDNFLRSQQAARRPPFDKETLHGLARVVRNVWRAWTTVHPSVAPPRSLFVTRLICASFFMTEVSKCTML